MSSIDWQRLTREHDAAPELDDDAWLEALAILDEDPEERRLAEEADPLLMFRRLPAPRVEGSDIESMKAAVQNLRQASETLAENPPSRPSLSLASLSPRSWAPAVSWRTGAVAARRLLPLAALLVLGVSLALFGVLGTAPTEEGVLIADYSMETSSLEPSFEPLPIQTSKSRRLPDRIQGDRIQADQVPVGAGIVRAELRAADRDLGYAPIRFDGAALAAAELPLVEDADPASDLLMQIENEEMSLVVVLTGQDV